MGLKPQSAINIRNKKASFEYEFLERYVAGIQLQGTEIKSIRKGKVSIGESYCHIHNGEMFVKGLHIAEYEFASHFNHETRRERKLLLQKKELRKLERKLKESGLTIIPIKLFMTDRGLVKLEIALCKGKKTFDKRESIKQKDVKRDMDRMMKF